MQSKKQTHVGKRVKNGDGHQFDWIDGIYLIIVIGLPCLIVYLLMRG